MFEWLDIDSESLRRQGLGSVKFNFVVYKEQMIDDKNKGRFKRATADSWLFTNPGSFSAKEADTFNRVHLRLFMGLFKRMPHLAEELEAYLAAAISAGIFDVSSQTIQARTGFTSTEAEAINSLRAYVSGLSSEFKLTTLYALNRVLYDMAWWQLRSRKGVRHLFDALSWYITVSRESGPAYVRKVDASFLSEGSVPGSVTEGQTYAQVDWGINLGDKDLNGSVQGSLGPIQYIRTYTPAMLATLSGLSEAECTLYWYTLSQQHLWFALNLADYYCKLVRAQPRFKSRTTTSVMTGLSADRSDFASLPPIDAYYYLPSLPGQHVALTASGVKNAAGFKWEEIIGAGLQVLGLSRTEALQVIFLGPSSKNYELAWHTTAFGFLRRHPDKDVATAWASALSESYRSGAPFASFGNKFQNPTPTLRDSARAASSTASTTLMLNFKFPKL